jgi:hypothetical protein
LKACKDQEAAIFAMGHKPTTLDEAYDLVKTNINCKNVVKAKSQTKIRNLSVKQAKPTEA